MPMGGVNVGLAPGGYSNFGPTQGVTAAPGTDPNTSGGSSFSGGDIGSLLQLLGGGAGLINSIQLGNDAQQVFGQSNPFGAYRPMYGNQLLNLMQNPSSVTSLPGYQFLMNQGIQAVDRSAAAPGGVGLGGGGNLGALEQYGQGLADQFYQQQVATLSGLAGSNISPANPYNALQGLGGAATSMGSSIAGLGGGLSQLFGPGGAFANYFNTPNSNTNITDAYNTIGNTNPFTGQPNQPTSPGDAAINAGMVSSDPSLFDGSSGGGGDSIDLSGLFSNPRAAGGEAATPTGTGTAMNPIQSALSAYSAISGLTSGNPLGELGGGMQGLSLLNNYGALGGTPNLMLGAGLGVGGGVLGLYSGLKEGGVPGYGGAIAGGLQAGAGIASLEGMSTTVTDAASMNTALADSQLAGELGSAAGAIAIPLSLYSFAKNWQSGATGSDALGGAEAGAAIGTAIMPGIGTIAGGLIGGGVGAISSLFGSGSSDPEQATFSSFLSAYNKYGAAGVAGAGGTADFQALAGLFDMRSSDLPFYQQYGRMGEGPFMEDMFAQIDSAIKSGKISASATPEQIYQQVVNPWIGNMPNSSSATGKGWDFSGTGSGGGDPNGIYTQGVVPQLLVNLIGNYQQGQQFDTVGGTPVQLPAYA